MNANTLQRSPTFYAIISPTARHIQLITMCYYSYPLCPFNNVYNNVHFQPDVMVGTKDTKMNKTPITAVSDPCIYTGVCFFLANMWHVGS